MGRQRLEKLADEGKLVLSERGLLGRFPIEEMVLP